MPETSPPPAHADRDHPVGGHERSDVSFTGVLWFGAGLVIFVLVVNVVMAWLFWLLNAAETRAKESVFPLAQEERRRGLVLPPEPRLEGLEPSRGTGPPAIDPDSYGWVDEKKGIVHIPVKAAAERALAEGIFKVRQEPEKQGGGR
jgi:hypothetical protein